MLHRHRVMTVFFVVLAGLFFVTGLSAAGDAGAQDKVKAYYLPIISFGPVVIAYEEGFFKDEGIDLEFVELRNAADAFLLLLQGGIDTMQTPPIAGMFNAAAEGKNIKVVSGVGYYKKDSIYTGLAVRGAKSAVADLKNKKLGIAIPGSFSHYMVDRLLDEAGLSLDKDVELTTMTFPSAALALENGTLDAAELIEPFISRIAKKTELSVVSYPQEGPISFYLFGPRILDERPAVGARFLAAFLKGCRQYDEGKTPRNIEILKKYTKLEEETLKDMEWPDIRPGSIRDASNTLQGYQDWLKAKGYLNAEVETRTLVDTRFLDKAEAAFKKK